MEVTYKRKFSQSYMIINEKERSHNIYELMVFTYNKVPELLPIETIITDGEISFWYDITGRQTLTDYLGRREVDLDLLLLLFQSIDKVINKIKDFLLEETAIVLEPEYIYMDFERSRLEFVYLSGRETDIKKSFQELMEFILRKLNHGDQKATAMAYEMYQLSMEKALSFPDMLKRAMTMMEESEEQEELYSQRGFLEPEERTEEPEKTDWLRKGFKENEKKGLGWIKKYKLGKTEKIERMSYVTQEQELEVYPTEILNEMEETKGIFMYQGQALLPDIKINKEIFLIGKKEKEVDGYIEQKSISRVHARIEIVGDTYYIEDLNSTNGTYLNGERLEYRQKVMLETGDRVTFGAEEYLFL